LPEGAKRRAFGWHEVERSGELRVLGFRLAAENELTGLAGFLTPEVDSVHGTVRVPEAAVPSVVARIAWERINGPAAGDELAGGTAQRVEEGLIPLGVMMKRGKRLTVEEDLDLAGRGFELQVRGESLAHKE